MLSDDGERTISMTKRVAHSGTRPKAMRRTIFDMSSSLECQAYPGSERQQTQRFGTRVLCEDVLAGHRAACPQVVLRYFRCRALERRTIDHLSVRVMKRVLEWGGH